MSLKAWVIIGLFVGSTAGSYVPSLWSDPSLLSFTSLFFALLGGIVGAWAGYQLYEYTN